MQIGLQGRHPYFLIVILGGHKANLRLILVRDARRSTSDETEIFP